VLADVRRKGLVNGFNDTNKDEGSWIRKKKNIFMFSLVKGRLLCLKIGSLKD